MIEAYRTLLTSGKDASLTLEKKHLYLEIIARILEAENTIALTNYHSGISFILFTIVKGSFSALPVVAFTFLSQGAAIGVIIAAFVVCYAIKMLIDKFAPKPAIVKNNASETELANFERHLHHSSRDSRRISLDSDTEERRTDSISRPNSHLLRQKASLSTPSPLSYLRGLCKNPFFLGKKTQDNRASYAGSADAEPLLSPS
jgi:hypothetical protein